LAASTTDARVLGWIPNKLEEAIVMCLFKNDDGGLVDLAADADDAPSHDGGGISCRH
jgi:hypothetical protein